MLQHGTRQACCFAANETHQLSGADASAQGRGTLLCTSVVASNKDDALAECAAALNGGADIVELRLDFLRQADTSTLEALVEATAKQCIVTCRPSWEG